MTVFWQCCPVCSGSGWDSLLGALASKPEPCPTCKGQRVIRTPEQEDSPGPDLVADISLLVARLNSWDPTIDVRNAQRSLTEAMHFVKQAKRRGRSA